jgi:drug/metabolite transporter (DMT)-like permease
MKQNGEVKNFAPRALLGVLRRVLQSGWMWLGIGLMALAFFSFLTLLSWAKVSFVVPATAANYIAGALGAKFLLKERVGKTRWAGMLLVAAGVALVCAAR